MKQKIAKKLNILQPIKILLNKLDLADIPFFKILIELSNIFKKGTSST